MSPLIRWSAISDKESVAGLIRLLNRRLSNVLVPEEDAAPEVIQASQSYVQRLFSGGGSSLSAGAASAESAAPVIQAPYVSRFRYHGGSSLAAPCCSSSPTVTPGTGPVDTINCILWLQGSSLLESLSDGALVSFWRDDSGSGNHATQTVAGTYPLLKTAIVNGQPVVRFDNVDDGLITAVARGTGAPFTAYAVYAAKRAGEAVVHTILHGSDTFSNSWWMAWHNNHLIRAQWPGAVNYIEDSATVANAFHVQHYTRPTSDAGTGRLYTDNTAAGTALTGDLTAMGTSLALGAAGTGYNAFPADADVAEVLVYSVEHTTAQQTAVARYLGTKYAITVA